MKKHDIINKYIEEKILGKILLSIVIMLLLSPIILIIYIIWNDFLR